MVPVVGDSRCRVYWPICGRSRRSGSRSVCQYNTLLFGTSHTFFVAGLLLFFFGGRIIHLLARDEDVTLRRCVISYLVDLMPWDGNTELPDRPAGVLVSCILWQLALPESPLDTISDYKETVLYTTYRCVDNCKPLLTSAGVYGTDGAGALLLGKLDYAR